LHAAKVSPANSAEVMMDSCFDPTQSPVLPLIDARCSLISIMVGVTCITANVRQCVPPGTW
jgi:hypothetical protein